MLVKIISQGQLSQVTQYLQNRLIKYKTFNDNDQMYIYTDIDIDLPDITTIPEIPSPKNINTRPISIGKNTLFATDTFSVIAGPCAIEDETSLAATAELLKKHNVKMLRGGVNKLRTSPYSFQGLGMSAATTLSKVAHDFGLYSVCEITSISEIDVLEKYIDILVVGTRNMHNYPLLKELGHLDKPIILKRGMASTVKEWVQASEYIRQNGNDKIILCERGIRTFENSTRNTFDLASAVYVTQNYPYIVITDPSHATGDRELVTPMTLASYAAKTHGVMIEIHPQPQSALSDGQQMLDFEQFENLMRTLGVRS